MTTALPFQAQQPIFEKMGGISELRHMSPEDRNRYMYSLNKYRTNLSVMKNEREKGRAEGRADHEKEMVMRMLSLGMGAKEIANILGIEIGKVELIISKS